MNKFTNLFHDKLENFGKICSNFLIVCFYWYHLALFLPSSVILATVAAMKVSDVARTRWDRKINDQYASYGSPLLYVFST